MIFVILQLTTSFIHLKTMIILQKINKIKLSEKILRKNFLMIKVENFLNINK